MEMQDVREIAKTMGLKTPVTVSKVGLIRSIQRTEGNFDCFATATDGVCDQSGCRWRQDCFGYAKKTRKPS